MQTNCFIKWKLNIRNHPIQSSAQLAKKDENSGIEPLELGQKKHPSIPNNQQKGQLKC